MTDTEVEFFRSIDDPRGTPGLMADPVQWRILLRHNLYKKRGGRSDLTKASLNYGYEMHEALFSRAAAPKSAWQVLLFSGPNCLLLTRAEHRPSPPDRVTAYWLAVANYGIEAVNRYIASLPFKSAPSCPWTGTYGLEAISRISDRFSVSKEWLGWFERVKYRLDNVAESSLS